MTSQQSALLLNSLGWMISPFCSHGSDGYWVMLKPLHVGRHMLHFTGKDPAGTQDVTYNITVTKARR